MSNIDFAQIEPCLSAGTISALKSFGFTKMTPVQAATIPLFLTNKVSQPGARSGTFAIDECYELTSEFKVNLIMSRGLEKHIV